MNSMVISSSIDNIEDVFRWLNNSLFNKINNKEKINNISLVIQEALVNSIVHGNLEDQNKKVYINYEIRKDLVYFKIEDEGQGIPLNKQLKDSTNINENDLFKDSGRGIILMKHFCTELVFNKNILELLIEI